MKRGRNLDQKLTISRVWNELEGSMRAPCIRRHELNTNQNQKSRFLSIFRSIHGQNMVNYRRNRGEKIVT